MKHLKRAACLVLAAAFTATSCIPAHMFGGGGLEVSASEVATTNSGLTIEGAVAGHTYKVYQIFKGNVSADGTKLSNVTNGANYTSNNIAADLEALEAEGADAKAFIKEHRDQITVGDPVTTLTVENPSADLEAGYYLVMDESDGTAANDAISDYIVSVIGNVIVKPKAVTVPGFDKSIDEDAAAETPKKQTTLTVTNPEDGYTYKVYQIFTGDVEDGKLVNAGYGANYEGSGNIENDVDTFNNAADKKEYAVSIKDAIKGKESPVTTLNKGNPSATVDGGFYVIIVEDEDGNEAADGAVADGENLDNEVTLEKPEIPVGGNILSPDITLADWNYTLNEAGKTITLNYYQGSDQNVTVYGSYKIQGSDTEYKTILQNNSNPNPQNYMFVNCVNIQSVIFSDDLNTSTCTGMAYMFSGASNLKSIDFGNNFDTSKVGVMDGMFENCSSLEYLNLSRFNTARVHRMEYMFNGCRNLRSINFGNFDTTSVTIMHGMFGYCSNMTSLDLSGFDTANVTNMENMFSYCSRLSNLNVSNFDTGCVTSMAYMFNECRSLKTLNIRNFNTENVTNMSGMFFDCMQLENLNLTSFNTEQVTLMAYMFYNCSSLAEIRVTEGKWVTEQANTNNIFLQCSVSSVATYPATSAATPLSLFTKAFASGTDTEITPAAIEITGDDKTVDYAVGDHVPFKLEATMPESISAYEKYKLVFHDKITGGMSYDHDSLKVYADGVEITDTSAYVVEWGADGKTLAVTMNDVKVAPYSAAAGTKITVKYTTTLLEEGADGAANEASLDYSNDPNGEGMGTTGGEDGDPDVVEVITFSMKFDKVDKNGNALPGAGFTLYRKGDDGEFAAVETIDGTTAFDFDGLKPGDYKFVESTTPDGYNTMEDLLFSIVADKITGEDGESVITVKLLGADGNALFGWTADASAKAFESDIANYSGSTLPSTGGIGTYLFYIAGAGLVILIGFVMVTRKKMETGK